MHFHNLFSQDEPIVEPSPVAHSTPGPCAAGLTIVDSATETPERSRYLPSDQSVLEASVGTPVAVHESSLDKLNTFLRSRDVSPVRNVLKTSWSEASERTQHRHVRKARQAVGVVLDEVAPARSDDLWKALVASKPVSSGEESDQEDVDVVLMQALGECYANANTWKTRRQILSIVANKFTFHTLKKWFPELTKWRFTVARKHALLHGRGTFPPKITQARMYVTPKQVEHLERQWQLYYIMNAIPMYLLTVSV